MQEEVVRGGVGEFGEEVSGWSVSLWCKNRPHGSSGGLAGICSFQIQGLSTFKGRSTRSAGEEAVWK